MARAIGFFQFKDDYRAMDTDLQHTSITLNLDGKPKRVTAYGPHMLAHDGVKAMAGYMQLWNMLREIAPYRKTESHAASSEEARARIRSIFGPIP